MLPVFFMLRIFFNQHRIWSVCFLGGGKTRCHVKHSNALSAGEIDSTNYFCASNTFQLKFLHFADVGGGLDIINNAARFSALVEKFHGEHTNMLLLRSAILIARVSLFLIFSMPVSTAPMLVTKQALAKIV